MATCDDKYPLVASPTAKGINKLLWGDWKTGNFGVLVRRPDRYDNRNVESVENTPLLPASFVHASLRAPNSLFFKHRVIGAAVVVGSRFGNNYAMHHRNDGGDIIFAPVCYPTDAGSNQRPAILTNVNGTGCHERGPKEGVCVEGTCLSTPATGCACEVPGNQLGKALVDYLYTQPDLVEEDGKVRLPNFLAPYSCWYKNNLRGMQEIIAASDSIWRERSQWSARNDSRYGGWTECPVTSNIRNHRNIDAILIQLPISVMQKPSLCDYPQIVEQDLQVMLLHGIYRINPKFMNLPVVFLGQTEGMSNQTECDMVWGGTRCDNGYRKEVFSRPFNFSDGSRFAQPQGCKDVYYFPPGVAVSSDICQMREVKSPYHQLSVDRKTSSSALDPFSMQQLEEPHDDYSGPSSTIPACFNLMIMIGCYWLLGWRKRGRTSVR